jgi:hypothetical protein
LAEGSDRVGGANEHFSVANRRDSKFNATADITRIEELGLEISRVVGMQNGLAVVSLIGPNNLVPRDRPLTIINWFDT